MVQDNCRGSTKSAVPDDWHRPQRRRLSTDHKATKQISTQLFGTDTEGKINKLFIAHII